MLFVLLLACHESMDGEHIKSQYNPPEPVGIKVDTFTQKLGAVDVLWVIDNSCSMAEEQQALRSNFRSFLEPMASTNVDYHVGVITTDMEDPQQSGKLQFDKKEQERYLQNSGNPETEIRSFEERASVGTMGASIEKGKDAIFTALGEEATQTNSGFLRKEVDLSIIVVSDELDFSAISVPEFVSFLQQLKAGTPNAVSFSSIVGLTSKDCPSAERGDGYLEVTDAIGGVKASICESDWEGLMEDLSADAIPLDREFFLTAQPVPETIQVQVGDAQWVEQSWQYNEVRNSIVFDTHLPAAGAVVEVSYEARQPLNGG